MYWPRLISATGSRPRTLAQSRFEIGLALVDGAQPVAFAAQVFFGDGAQGVGFGRQLFLALPLLGGARIAPALGLAQRLGGQLARRRQ